MKSANKTKHSILNNVNMNIPKICVNKYKTITKIKCVICIRSIRYKSVAYIKVE